MKKVLNFTPQTALNINHRKENQFSDSFTLFDLTKNDHNGKPVAAVELRVYYQSGKTCYACAWVNFRYVDGVGNASGSGRATGYGYDKKEAACMAALRSAGFEIDTKHQECQPGEALKLVAEWFGLAPYFVHHSHA